MQAVLFDVGNHIAVVLPGGVLDVGAGEGNDLGQLDETEAGVFRRFGRLLFLGRLVGCGGGFGVSRRLGRFGTLLFPGRLTGSVGGGLGVRRGLGWLGGLLSLGGLVGSISGGLGVRRGLGRLGGFL